MKLIYFGLVFLMTMPPLLADDTRLFNGFIPFYVIIVNTSQVQHNAASRSVVQPVQVNQEAPRNVVESSSDSEDFELDDENVSCLEQMVEGMATLWNSVAVVGRYSLERVVASLVNIYAHGQEDFPHYEIYEIDSDEEAFFWGAEDQQYDVPGYAVRQKKQKTE